MSILKKKGINLLWRELVGSLFVAQLQKISSLLSLLLPLSSLYSTTSLPSLTSSTEWLKTWPLHASRGILGEDSF